jgi:hypothetical protein
MNFCDKGKRTSDLDKKDWIQKPARLIYGNSAFDEKNRVRNNYEILNPLKRKINLNCI